MRSSELGLKIRGTLRYAMSRAGIGLPKREMLLILHDVYWRSFDRCGWVALSAIQKMIPDFRRAWFYNGELIEDFEGASRKIRVSNLPRLMGLIEDSPNPRIDAACLMKMLDRIDSNTGTFLEPISYGIKVGAESLESEWEQLFCALGSGIEVGYVPRVPVLSQDSAPGDLTFIISRDLIRSYNYRSLLIDGTIILVAFPQQKTKSIKKSSDASGNKYFMLYDGLRPGAECAVQPTLPYSDDGVDSVAIDIEWERFAACLSKMKPLFYHRPIVLHRKEHGVSIYHFFDLNELRYCSSGNFGEQIVLMEELSPIFVQEIVSTERLFGIEPGEAVNKIIFYLPAIPPTPYHNVFSAAAFCSERELFFNVSCLNRDLSLQKMRARHEVCHGIDHKLRLTDEAEGSNFTKAWQSLNTQEKVDLSNFTYQIFKLLFISKRDWHTPRGADLVEFFPGLFEALRFPNLPARLQDASPIIRKNFLMMANALGESLLGKVKDDAEIFKLIATILQG